MDDGDTCPVCFDIFTLPKLLPCQHTFCLQCLKDYCNRVSKNCRSTQQTHSGNDYSSDSKQNNIICPLCRNVCSIPQNGLEDLMTNYFVKRTQTPKQCEICDEADVVKYCKMCYMYVCYICFRSHDHKVNTFSTEEDDEESQEPRDPRLPFHLLVTPGIRTEYICELQRTFKLDIPPDDRGMRPVYSVIIAKEGGAYVVAANTPFILKYDFTGKLLRKIRTPDRCDGIIELSNGDILGIFRTCNLILRFMFGGWSYFTAVSDYTAWALTELSDGKILVCGEKEWNAGKDNENTTRGILRLYSEEGILLEEIDKRMELVSPDLIVSNKQEKTFAVGETKRNVITVFRENGEELRTYSGGIGFCQLLIFQTESVVNFDPIEMCCSHDGNYVISSADGTLHILDHTGNLLGIALANCKDGFGRMTDIAIESKEKMWCSNSEFGTIKIFSMKKFKNRFRATDLTLI